MLSFKSTEHFTSVGASSGACEVGVHMVMEAQSHGLGSARARTQVSDFLGGSGGSSGCGLSTSVHQPDGEPPPRPWCPALQEGSGAHQHHIFQKAPREYQPAHQLLLGALLEDPIDLFPAF